MATYNDGINGPFQGKVGTVVGYYWKGKPVMRAKPKKRGPQRGELEKSNQSDFAFVHRWLKPLIYFLRVGFNGYSEQVHAFNAAKSMALKNAFVGKIGSRVFDPSLVQVSWGDLPLSSGISVSKTADLELTFNWEVNPKEYTQDPMDQVMLLAYDPAKKQKEMVIPGQFRKVGSEKLSFEKPGKYHIYVAFVAADRSRQSESLYLGEIQID